MREKETWHDVYLALGTNLGEKELNIHTALKYIEERVGKVIACSSFLVTHPVGFESENQFLNAACHVRTELTPQIILSKTQAIEKEMGRLGKSENGVYSDRVIDIDILLYDDFLIKTEGLTIPHPLLHERDFVLIPLAEIAKNVLHPILRKKIGDL